MIFLNNINLPLYFTLFQLCRSVTCSSPRKEKYSKSPSGKYLVPHEQISRVNPNEGKQGGIPEKESPGITNHKGDPSWRQTEIIPRCWQEKLQQRSHLEPKGINSEVPEGKLRGQRSLKFKFGFQILGAGYSILRSE